MFHDVSCRANEIYDFFVFFNQHIVAAHEYVSTHLSCFFWIYVRPWVSPKLCSNYALPQYFQIRKLGEIPLFFTAIASYYVLCWFSAWFGYKLIKPFHVFGLLIYLPEDIRMPLVFWCFQGLKKQISGKQWVIWKSPYSGLSCSTKDRSYQNSSPWYISVRLKKLIEPRPADPKSVALRLIDGKMEHCLVGIQQWSSHVTHTDPFNFFLAIWYCCGGIW